MIGRELAHYTITAKIGEGGMGEVYRARDTRLGRDVAVKFLPDVFAQDPDRLARFEREAQLLATLNHPSIAAVYGLEQADGHRCFIMELVEGEDVSVVLERGPIPVDDVIPIAIQVAEALEAAHESGIIHRDLKPANIKLRTDGRVKVLDFGLGKALEAEPNDSGAALTQSPTLTGIATGANVILGTAAYMSPEQARGRWVDRRTDIWSFGCVLYECLTGKQAFEGETVSDLIAKVLEREPDWDALPERTPPRVRALLRRCLTKDPSLRLRDIGEARIALATPDAEAEISSDSAAPSSTRKNALWPWVVTVVVAAAAVALQVLGPRGGSPPQPLWLDVMLPPDQRLDAGPEFNVLTVSPDGMSLAYVGLSEGAYRLYIRRFDDGSLHALPETENARDPFFSPNGEWVGFFAENTLKKVSVRGGTPVDLAEVSSDRGAVWAPDGSIVYTPTFGSSLFRISENGGDPESFTTLDSTNAERTHRWPDAFGDSEWIVFTVGTTDSPGDYDECDIDVVSLRTGERRTVARGAFAKFGPDGRLVVGRSGSLYVLPVDPRDPRKGGAAEPVLDGVLGHPTSGATFFDIAENGTLVYAPGRTGGSRSRLAWVDLKGSTSPLPIDPLDFNKVVLSPDGNRALLEVGPGQGAGSDIWLLDLVDYTLSTLTFEGGGSSPSMFSDGKRFVYESDNYFVVQTLDGSDSARVITVEQGLHTISSVTPDGSEILFSYYGAVDADVWSVPVDGGDSRVVVGGRLSQSSGVVSPDSRWIAYVSNETGDRQVCVRPWKRPGSVSQISREDGFLPFWSPTGDTLFYVSQGAVYLVPLTAGERAIRGGTPERLFDVNVNSDSSFHEIELHPSGKKFLVRVPESASERREIAVVPGWVSGLDKAMEKK